MHVNEFMTRDVITITASADLHDAVERMATHRIRHLPVVDGDGHLTGVITDRDVRHHLFTPDVLNDIGHIQVDTLLKAVPVGDIMSTPAVSVDSDAPVDSAVRLMLEHKLGSLPVVERGRVVGIITETDLLRRIVREDACCQPVEAIVVSYP